MKMGDAKAPPLFFANKLKIYAISSINIFKTP